MPDTGLFQSVACSELKNSLSLTHFSEQRMALVFVSLLSSHALIPEGYSPRRDLRQALKSTPSWQAQLSSFAKLHPNATNLSSCYNPVFRLLPHSLVKA